MLRSDEVDVVARRVVREHVDRRDQSIPQRRGIDGEEGSGSDSDAMLITGVSESE